MTYDLDKLNQILNAHRWNAANLALNLGLDVDRVRGILKGKIRPKRDEMERICRISDAVEICEIEITEFVA